MTPQARRFLWLAVRVVVSTVCVAWVLRSVPWTDRLDPGTGAVLSRGFLSALGDVFDQRTWLWLLAGVVAYALSPLFGAMRWRMLMAVQGIRLNLGQAWRLTYIGFFYNTFLLGLTGGDLVKAWYAARQAHDKKAEAVATVFLDRLIGLFGLALLCMVALAFRWNDPAMLDVRRIVLIFIAVAAVLAILLFSRRMRRWLRLEALRSRLPLRDLVARVDAAVIVYRDHLRTVLAAILLSWVAHVVSIAAVYFSARALGLNPSPHHFLIYMPVIWIAASVLPSVGGLGPMEYLATVYFTAGVLGLGPGGDARGQALATILLFRLVMFAAVLPGGVLHALHGDVSVRQARLDLKEAADSHG